MADWNDVQGYYQLRNPTWSGAFFSMGLSALVYLDPASYTPALERIYPGIHVAQRPSPGQFAPAIVYVGSNQFGIVAFEGTRGWQAWQNYVVNAGSVPFGRRGGRVFQPFAQIATAVEGNVKAVLPLGADVVFAGHSLGAACVPLCMDLTGQTREIKRGGYAFAQPRFADSVYVSSFPLRVYVFNHRLDVIPLLPTDAISLLADDPYTIGWGSPFNTSAAPYLLDGGSVQPLPVNTPDFLAAIIAAGPDFRNSPHQTYWYIRILWNHLDLRAKAQLSDYASLLRDLGLFDPWPAVV
jgi:Lipase (class 3)